MRAVRPKNERRRDIQDKGAACAHPCAETDEVRVARRGCAVERPPLAARRPGRLEGAVLIRLETDVGGLSESLASWRVQRAVGRDNKTRGSASSAFGVLPATRPDRRRGSDR